MPPDISPTLLRVLFFVSIFAIMAILEFCFPRRALTQNKPQRWLNNLALTFFNSLLLKLIFPVLAIEIALNNNSNPSIFILILSIMFLDLVIYWQHRLFHKFNFLWRIHRVHHADLDIDVTTGARFHTIEIFLSMLIKIFFIYVLKISFEAVLIFEILLNATAMFNHANFKLNKDLDKFLRTFLVTPDMHRVHHSSKPKELNTNFGFNLSFWDRIFMTYRAQPKLGHTNMQIGLEKTRSPKDCVSIIGMLKMPIKKFQ